MLACEKLPRVLQVPTGTGKTAAVILGWLYRRRFAGESVRKQTPRRLVLLANADTGGTDPRRNGPVAEKPRA